MKLSIPEIEPLPRVREIVVMPEIDEFKRAIMPKGIEVETFDKPEILVLNFQNGSKWRVNIRPNPAGEIVFVWCKLLGRNGIDRHTRFQSKSLRDAIETAEKIRTKGHF